MKYVRHEKLNRNQSSLNSSLFSSAEVPGSCQCSHPARVDAIDVGLSSGLFLAEAVEVNEGLLASAWTWSVAADAVTSAVIVLPGGVVAMAPNRTCVMPRYPSESPSGPESLPDSFVSEGCEALPGVQL